MKLTFWLVGLLMAAALTQPAYAQSRSEAAEEAVVVSVSPSRTQVPRQWSQRTGAVVGGAIGSAAGYAVSRDRGNAGVATVVAGAIGTAIGNRFDHRRSTGNDVILRVSSGRMVALFLSDAELPNGLRAGDQVYLVGSRRLVYLQRGGAQ